MFQMIRILISLTTFITQKTTNFDVSIDLVFHQDFPSNPAAAESEAPGIFISNTSVIDV
jgi:hypothetical protein